MATISGVPKPAYVYDATSDTWFPISGSGARGGGSDKVFWENDATVTASYTITAGKNAVTAGPVSINSGVTVTIPTGSVWVVV